MLIAEAAKKLEYQVAVLDPSFYCSAARHADQHIIAEFSDANAYRKLADTCDVLTYEFEHIDTDILHELEAKGNRLYPSAPCLAGINDKYKQKQILENAGIPVPAFHAVDEEDASPTLDRLGIPLVFKFRRGGYDGKGNIVARTADEARKVWNALIRKDAMAEQFIRYERELSILAAKDQNGNVAFYPLAENLHEDGVLRLTRAPARVDDDIRMKALGIAKSVLSVFDSPGLFCIEMFLDANHNLFVNEIAPRPHNSGHHTLDACRTSQYEQLVRILTGLPLGETDQVSPCVMANILGNETVQGEYLVEGIRDIAAFRNAHFYWYGKKTTKHLRKLGHITVLDGSIEAAEALARRILKRIVLKPRQI